MSELLARQQTLLQSVAKALANFKKLGRNNYSPAKIRARVTALKETWNQCVNCHVALLQTIPEAKRKEVAYFEAGEFDQHEELYQTTLDYMADCLEELEPPASASSVASPVPRFFDTSSFSLSHLPPIKIPPFSGKPEEWESFRDRFRSLIIDNKDLNAFARMHFLASSLSGSALDSIKTVPITADNFEIAWQILVSRYDNKRRLIDVHVSSLFNLPSVSRESSSELSDLRDKANRAIASLKRLDRSAEEILSDMIVYTVTQKLDHATRKAWKLKGSDESTIPKYEELDRFLAARARALEELTPLNSNKFARSSKSATAAAAIASTISCPLCKSSHFINKCPQFMKKSPSQRLEIIKQAQRCTNCFSIKHAVSACSNQFSCRKCNKKHHTLLHNDLSSASTAIVAAPSADPPSETSESSTATALSATSLFPNRPPVLLATARVVVSSFSGRSKIVRALIDQGSEITMITERLGQSLKLRRVRMPISICAVGCVDAGKCLYAALIKISPVNNSEPVLVTTASMLPSLTKYSPSRAQDSLTSDHLADLLLADPSPTSADPIEIIIGADLYGEIILDGIRRGLPGEPIAQSTIFGWILSGPTSSSISSPRLVTSQHCSNADSFTLAHSLSLDNALRRFWELEEVPRRAILSPDDQKCENHFLATHSRDSDGRYVVRLPFTHGPPIDVGQSRNTAVRCLNALLRRLNHNAALRKEYSEFLREYEELGHMIQAASPPESSQSIYIPHHPVIRDSSSTTRLRVVFNASSLTSNGKSLNDGLLIGQKLQTELAAVILRWRQFKYVYSADITKMYRQIRVDPRDADYQRILWRDKDSDSIQEYKLLTVTYGTASAPFLALRVLQQLVADEGHLFPLADPVLRDNIYVDDVLFGADDIPLIRRTRDEVNQLLKRGCFELRKWSSNTAALLADIPADNHGLACSKTLKTDEQLKILGVNWIPSRDNFQFSTSCSLDCSPTKRSILSTIARIFDPLGWGTPVTIAAKIFLQKLWQLRIDWDENLPLELLTLWETIKTSLSDLNGLPIERWVGRGADTMDCELHGFSDASQHAYAAAVYMRLVSVSGEVNTTLLVGKSKVAPIKPLSIPRLELAAAVLLSHLIEFVKDSLHLPTVSCVCWTDSMVVLAWVTQHPSRWKTFVSNRVADIQSRIPFASWRYVPTADNPSDCASRGILGNQLKSHPLWWHGPSWLRMSPSDWPKPANLSLETCSLEQKLVNSAHLAKVREPWDLSSRYSSWPKLLRVTAYVMRFISRARSRAHALADHNASPLSLSVDELQQAKIFWLQQIQQDVFSLERDALLNNKPLASKSAILSLNPFVDDKKIIRVGGRLSHAPISIGAKHPIILASHSLTKLIVEQAHLRAIHGGVQLTLVTLRQDFWLLRARSLVKAVIHRCVTCVREQAAVPTQLMGDLPRVRVTPPSRAFLNCGLDYAGPILIRAMSGRGVASRKAYIAVFICMATRAIHLEVVEGYSTSAFLGAYSRFIARRGLPAAMYSDNGTTFVGADREMTAAFRTAVQDPDFRNRTASDNVSWHFMPPSAPHFGGLWEAGVRSVKHHLRRVVGSHTLTFEELATLLCNIEACLNSRPLAPLSDSFDDCESLTPGHFLIGTALTSRPEPSLLDVKENRLTRWQLVRQLSERFWKLWQNAYINTLQQRVKWRRRMEPGIEVGRLVLLRNSLLPPCKWELARICQCHPGPDGLIRVATVKTAASEFKRPINKLCLLPIDIENDARRVENDAEASPSTPTASLSSKN